MGSGTSRASPGGGERIKCAVLLQPEITRRSIEYCCEDTQLSSIVVYKLPLQRNIESYTSFFSRNTLMNGQAKSTERATKMRKGMRNTVNSALSFVNGSKKVPNYLLDSYETGSTAASSAVRRSSSFCSSSLKSSTIGHCKNGGSQPISVFLCNCNESATER